MYVEAGASQAADAPAASHYSVQLPFSVRALLHIEMGSPIEMNLPLLPCNESMEAWKHGSSWELRGRRATVPLSVLVAVGVTMRDSRLSRRLVSSSFQGHPPPQSCCVLFAQAYPDQQLSEDNCMGLRTRFPKVSRVAALVGAFFPLKFLRPVTAPVMKSRFRHVFPPLTTTWSGGVCGECSKPRKTYRTLQYREFEPYE